MKYLIGIDIGTSGTKTVLFDQKGRIIASETAEYPLYQPKNGWAEQNPEDWYNAAVKTLKAVTGAVNPADIAGIGFSGQMHGLVMLDESDRVIRPAIIWCDQRTARECEEITDKVGAERLIEITANPALTGFTASKILWVRNNEPENYEKTRHILLPKDYVRFRLTGEFATDVSDASGTQLLNVPERCWSEEILKALSINPSLLPKLYESPEITGYITDEAAGLTGLLPGTPVVGGAGDNAAAAVGTGVVKDGRAFTTIGTSGVVYAHTDKIRIDKQGRVHTFCCAVPGCWHVMGVTQAAGLSLKWFRDNFCTDYLNRDKDPYFYMDKDAEKIPVGADKLIYLPYLMGERTPHLDPSARGVFFGLSAVHTRAHLIRAVMEGVAYSQLDSLSVLKEMGVEITSMKACGGGGTSALWRQILADMYNTGIEAAGAKEGAALGAAVLAGIGTGIYESAQKAADEIMKTDTKCEPIEKNSGYYKKAYRIYRKLYFDLKEDFAESEKM